MIAVGIATGEVLNDFPTSMVLVDQVFGLCQECYKNSALFAQFLLFFLLMFCYLISFAFIALTFTFFYLHFLFL